ncbi:MAG: P1 family peptidase [Chloroflexi bacterium]|nr:P1 family peptidase [Chloroflexota bacterium]
MHNAITDVAGIRVGHYTDEAAATGCTVILCEGGAVGGVDVRGSATGTREIELLRPVSLIQEVHAILLSGGSAYGLDAAGGVMRFLEGRATGFPTRAARVPIVPAAIIYDLAIGDARVRPGAEEAHQACLDASVVFKEGSVGAGTGATVGKALGAERATKGGLGTASQQVGNSVTVGALAVVNAFGDVVSPENGEILAGPRPEAGRGFASSVDIMCRGEWSRPSLTNTTLAIVATDAALNKEQTNKLAQMAQDGLARVLRPAHTMVDGDVVFALSTGKPGGRTFDVSALGAVAAQVLAHAIVRAITEAKGLCDIPSAREWKEM